MIMGATDIKRVAQEASDLIGTLGQRVRSVYTAEFIEADIMACGDVGFGCAYWLEFASAAAKVPYHAA